MLQLLRVPYYRRALSHGVAATVEHTCALARLQPATILDIGAHKGQFSTLCRKLFPDAHIIGFEPLEKPANIYEKCFAGDNNVTLFRKAVSMTTGDRKMFVSNRTDSSSLLEITSSQVEHFPGTELKTTATVTSAKLDQLLDIGALNTPVLLKIDVQGSELDVLRACDSIIKGTEAVYVEGSFVELYANQPLVDHVVRHLQSLDFQFSGMFNPSVDQTRKVIQADLLFERSTGRHHQ